MLLSYNGSRMINPYPLFSDRSIHVAIDSSKTNSALAVGDELYNLIGYIEMNGSADGTTAQDTLLLCKNERQALSSLFRGSTVLSFGIEDIITKNSGEHVGMSIHMSRFKITAVFMSFINFFMDTYNLTPHLINNQEWKSTILPKELNKKDVHKGSKDFLASMDRRFIGVSDDASDAICMLMFMKAMYSSESLIPIEGAELQRNDFIFKLFPSDYKFRVPISKFGANTNISLHDNVVYVSNRLNGKNMGKFDWSVSNLSFNEIYKYTYREHPLVEKNVTVVVQNTVQSEV